MSSELLHEVVVPAANQLEVEGLRGPLSCLNQARFGVAFGALGAGYACFGEVRRYTAERERFAEPLAHKQLVQAKLADMLADLTKGSLAGLSPGTAQGGGPGHPGARLARQT